MSRYWNGSGTSGPTCSTRGTARLTSALVSATTVRVAGRPSIIVGRGLDRRYIPLVDVDVVGGSEIEWVVVEIRLEKTETLGGCGSNEDRELVAGKPGSVVRRCDRLQAQDGVSGHVSDFLRPPVNRFSTAEIRLLRVYVEEDLNSSP